MLAKLTPAGALDPAFGGGDGIADLPDDFLALDVPPAYEPYGGTRGRPLLLTGDGIVVAGIDAAGRAAVVKLTPTGTGVIWGPRVIVSDASAAAAVAAAARRRLVVAGTTVAGPGRRDLPRGADGGRHGRGRRHARSVADRPPTSTGSSTCACRPAGRPSWRARP